MKVKNVLLFLLFPFLAVSQPANLPITSYALSNSTSDCFVLVVSGDGGWNIWEESLAKELVKRGVPVVGLDALKYFWSKKSPETVTADLTPVIRKYIKAWNKRSFILLGYSFGANVVPFIATRLQESERHQLSKVVLISPDPHGDFEIHVAGMFNLDWNDAPYDVAAEVKKIKDKQTLCLFGEGEDTDRTNTFRLPGVEVVTLPGKHHLRFEFKQIADLVLKQ
jgi:type IV secretory pathway VirJ component